MAATPASDRGGQQEDYKSAFVLGLAESQGTLAVVAALLAGFSFSGFCSVTREELERVHYVVQYGFSLSSSLSVSMALFVTIVCSLCEQQGRVARSFAVLRGHEPEFEDTVHEWWKSFAQIRTNAVFTFIYSIPVFFVSMACIASVKLPAGPCVVALGILLLAGCAVFHQLVVVNDLFRERILRFFTRSAGFAPPSLDREPTPGTIPAAKLNRSLSKAMLGTVKAWPSRQSSFLTSSSMDSLRSSRRFSTQGTVAGDDSEDPSGNERTFAARVSAVVEVLSEPDEGTDRSPCGVRKCSSLDSASPAVRRTSKRPSGAQRPYSSEGSQGSPLHEPRRGKSLPCLELPPVRDSPNPGLRQRRRTAAGGSLKGVRRELELFAAAHASGM